MCSNNILSIVSRLRIHRCSRTLLPTEFSSIDFHMIIFLLIPILLSCDFFSKFEILFKCKFVVELFFYYIAIYISVTNCIISSTAAYVLCVTECLQLFVNNLYNNFGKYQ